jgi:trehalose-phosphatase
LEEVVLTVTDIKSVLFKLKKARESALLLDYDGTLAPICVDRDKAFPYQGVREVLDVIIDSGNTHVVLISGRYINDLIPLISLKKTPEIWGSHGSEHLLADGTYEGVKLDEETISDLARADKWLKEHGYSGLLEVKPGCRAIHLRGVEKGYADDATKKILDNWAQICKDGQLEVHEFNGGIELRVSGKHKGIAVQTVLKEMGPDTFSVYLGDDLTDEDAFKAIKENGGVGILVKEKPTQTSADVWLKPPDELLYFLNNWERICREK